MRGVANVRSKKSARSCKCALLQKCVKVVKSAQLQLRARFTSLQRTLQQSLCPSVTVFTFFVLELLKNVKSF